MCFPFSGREFLFDPEELAAYFPPAVVKALVDGQEPATGEQGVDAPVRKSSDRCTGCRLRTRCRSCRGADQPQLPRAPQRHPAVCRRHVAQEPRRPQGGAVLVLGRRHHVELPGPLLRLVVAPPAHVRPRPARLPPGSSRLGRVLLGRGCAGSDADRDHLTARFLRCDPRHDGVLGRRRAERAARLPRPHRRGPPASRRRRDEPPDAGRRHRRGGGEGASGGRSARRTSTSTSIVGPVT